MKMRTLVSAVLVMFSGAAFAQTVSPPAQRAPVKEVVKPAGGAAQGSKEAAKKDLSKHSAILRAKKAQEKADNSEGRAAEKEDQVTYTQKNLNDAANRYNELNRAAQKDPAR